MAVGVDHDAAERGLSLSCFNVCLQTFGIGGNHRSLAFESLLPGGDLVHTYSSSTAVLSSREKLDGLHGRRHRINESAYQAAGAGMPDVVDWRNWLAEHGPSLVLLARQWVPDHADAQDAVQEAFLRFWRSSQQVSDPTAYVYACTRRYCLQWHRHRARRTRREESAARPESSGDRDLFVPIEQDERRKLIEAALGALPAEQREVVVMKIWGGLSFPQIAAALSISPNTAGSRYRYGLEKLKEQLAEEPAP